MNGCYAASHMSHSLAYLQMEVLKFYCCSLLCLRWGRWEDVSLASKVIQRNVCLLCYMRECLFCSLLLRQNSASRFHNDLSFSLNELSCKCSIGLHRMVHQCFAWLIYKSQDLSLLCKTKVVHRSLNWVGPILSLNLCSSCYRAWAHREFLYSFIAVLKLD